MMKRSLLISLALSAMVFSAGAASRDGKLGTLPRGTYGCELPGNAAGPTGILVAEAGFKIINASSYSTLRGSGTYLLTGKIVRMTSGPLRGQSFRRQGRTLLRQLNEDGSNGRMRCVLNSR